MAFHGLQLYSLLASPDVKRIQTPWLGDKAVNLCHMWGGRDGLNGVTAWPVPQASKHGMYSHTYLGKE